MALLPTVRLIGILGLPSLLPIISEARQAYEVERRGQDTYVRNAETGELVYTTRIDDTSEGSDTDQDMSGDEEFFHGCLWTFRQKLGICEGGNCDDAEIMAHDLQRRLIRFYGDRSLQEDPPLEEAAWLTVGIRGEDRQELFHSCPGLVATTLFFLAEALVFSGGVEGHSYAAEAERYTAAVQVQAPHVFETMLDMFPLQAAFQGYQLAATKTEQGLLGGLPTVDVVIAQCKSSLQWLWELTFPPKTRLFVYDKCGNDPEAFAEQTKGLDKVVKELNYHPMKERDGSDLMTGECTAYLTHVLARRAANDVAAYTIFAHDDGPRHIRLSMLSLALRGMRSGGYSTPFLHLSHERYPSFRTRCLRDVYQQVFGEELAGSLGTYCCAHFVVRRDRIEARPAEFYEHLKNLVESASYASRNGGLCNVGKKPCYVIEFLWHRIFGEEDELPPRALDPSLPLALRYEGGRETMLPSPLKVAPYMMFFHPNRYSKQLQQLR